MKVSLNLNQKVNNNFQLNNKNFSKILLKNDSVCFTGKKEDNSSAFEKFILTTEGKTYLKQARSLSMKSDKILLKGNSIIDNASKIYVEAEVAKYEGSKVLTQAKELLDSYDFNQVRTVIGKNDSPWLTRKLITTPAGEHVIEEYDAKKNYTRIVLDSIKTIDVSYYDEKEEKVKTYIFDKKTGNLVKYAVGDEFYGKKFKADKLFIFDASQNLQTYYSNYSTNGDDEEKASEVYEYLSKGSLLEYKTKWDTIKGEFESSFESYRFEKDKMVAYVKGLEEDILNGHTSSEIFKFDSKCNIISYSRGNEINIHGDKRSALKMIFAENDVLKNAYSNYAFFAKGKRSADKMFAYGENGIRYCLTGFEYDNKTKTRNFEKKITLNR